MPPFAGAAFSARTSRGESMMEKIGRAGKSPARGDGETRLLHEEDRIERDGFGERHADDGLDEDFAGSAGIAANAFNGLGADETDADGGGEAAERDVNTAGHFREGEVHGDMCCYCWLDFPSPARVARSRWQRFNAPRVRDRARRDRRRDCRSARC